MHHLSVCLSFYLIGYCLIHGGDTRAGATITCIRCIAASQSSDKKVYEKRYKVTLDKFTLSPAYPFWSSSKLSKPVDIYAVYRQPYVLCYNPRDMLLKRITLCQTSRNQEPGLYKHWLPEENRLEASSHPADFAEIKNILPCDQLNNLFDPELDEAALLKIIMAIRQILGNYFKQHSHRHIENPV